MFRSLLTRIPYLGRLYRGEIRLGRSFWLHFVVFGICLVPPFAATLGLAVGFIMVPLEPLIQADVNIEGNLVVDGLQKVFLFCFLGAGELYLYIATVGTWRSASAYMRDHKKGLPGAMLAKASLIIGLGAHALWLFGESDGESTLESLICAATVGCLG